MFTGFKYHWLKGQHFTLSRPKHLSRVALLGQSRKIFNLTSGLQHKQQQKSPENLR